MKEIWKPIEGYNGAYEVSNTGKVRSWKNNKWGRSKTPKLIRPSFMHKKYPQLGLSKNGIVDRWCVHRLVAEAFIPNPESNPCVNHKDLNPKNNNVENLEWCTYKENAKHAYDNGTHDIPRLKGEKHANSKLSKDDVLDIRNAYRLGCFTQKEISEAYNVSKFCIQSIVTRKSWKHI